MRSVAYNHGLVFIESSWLTFFGKKRTRKDNYGKKKISKQIKNRVINSLSEWIEEEAETQTGAEEL